MLRPYAYTHLFFDLDHTLWDFDTNARETLSELYHSFALQQHGLESEVHFIDGFFAVNGQLWDAHSKGQLDKTQLRAERFGRVFTHLGLDAASAPTVLGEEYIRRCSRKANLLPFAREILESLHGRYQLCILTNGFGDSQQHKLEASGILPYFDAVFTADTFACQKPDPAFFTQAMEKLAVKAQQCLMIGDNLKTDIMGAQAAGIDHVYYNPKKRPYAMQVQCDISCLSKLLTQLQLS